MKWRQGLSGVFVAALAMSLVPLGTGAATPPPAPVTGQAGSILAAAGTPAPSASGVLPFRGRHPAPSAKVPQTVSVPHPAPASRSPQLLVSSTAFDGANTGGSGIAPPDTNIAAGNGELVEAVNSTLYVYQENGTPVRSVPFNTFFSAPGGYTETDARVVYDPSSSRWFISALLFVPNSPTCASIVMLAVSAGANPDPQPVGSWHVYPLNNDVNDLQDQPKLGVSGDKVLVSWNDYPNDGSGNCGGTTYQLVGASLVAVQKTGLDTGVGVTKQFLYNRNTSRFGFEPTVPQVSQGGVLSSTAYVVYNNSDSNLNQNQLGPTLGVITVAGLPPTIATPVPETFPPLSPTATPPSAVELGGLTIDTGDDRILNAVIQGTDIWATATVACPTPNAGLPCSRFIEVSVSGTPSVTQTFDPPNTGEIYPAATFNSQHDMFAVTTHVSSSAYASVDQMFLGNGGAPSTILVNQIRRGAGIYSDGSPSPPYRWGDYSGAAIDPDHPLQVWVAAEYAAFPSSTTAWGTWIAPLNQSSAYTMDGYGGIHPAGEAPPEQGYAYWAGWRIARGFALEADPPPAHTTNGAGYTVDGFGGLHPFAPQGVTMPPGIVVTPGNNYWSGWDIVRGFAVRTDPVSHALAGGYTLDGYGGVHAVGGAPGNVTITAYWGGWDIAKAIVLDPTTQSSGYVLDGYGGLHPWAAQGTAMPGVPTLTGYWNWNIARAVVVRSDGKSGYTLDGYGGIHPWAYTGPGGVAMPAYPPGTAYWGGWDIARGLNLTSDTGGFVLDGWGGIHEFGPQLPTWRSGYWPGWDIAIAIA